MVSALVASLFFPQFFGKGTDALERQILGDRFEYHARVKNLIQTMKSFSRAGISCCWNWIPCWPTR